MLFHNTQPLILSPGSGSDTGLSAVSTGSIAALSLCEESFKSWYAHTCSIIIVKLYIAAIIIGFALTVSLCK